MNSKILIMSVFLFFLGIISVFGDIEPPTSATFISSSRHNNSGSMQFTGNKSAYAGNVTYITISGEGSTKTWAGYYGNVSGTLVLETVDDKTMYSWTLTNPGGKVLATETVVSDWNSIYCWNWSKATGQGLSWGEWNSNFSVGNSDVDAVNLTFNASYSYEAFYINGEQFSNTAGTRDGGKAGLCPAVELFDDSGAPAAGTQEFEEVILGRVAATANTDFDYDELIYLTLIESNTNGFTGEEVDFEIIVPNDGHDAGWGSSTSYYFYIELEAS